MESSADLLPCGIPQKATYCTNPTNPGRSRERWSRLLSHCYYPLETGRFESEHAFHGSVSLRQVGDINVSRFAAGAHQLKRTRQAIARRNRDTVLFVIPTKGFFSFEHMGREGLARTNDALLIYSSEPYTTQCSETYENICFEVAPSKLETGIPRIQDACGRTITLDSASQWFFKQNLAGALDNDSPDGSIASRISGYIINLAASSISQQFLSATSGHSRSYKDGLLQRIAVYIMNNLREPILGPQTIAAAHGISPSYLHKLFHGADISVNQMIIERRLALCMKELCNPALNSLSVTEIAYRAGFANSAHFSTRFKKRYGFPPREAREQATRT